MGPCPPPSEPPEGSHIPPQSELPQVSAQVTLTSFESPGASPPTTLVGHYRQSPGPLLAVPPQYSILWGQEGRCGHGGTCECTPCRAPGPQTTLHAAPLAGKVCWVFTPHRGLPPPHVCGERSAERTEPHPGDADLRPWMPRPALNSRATHSLKLHLIRPSLVVQGLGRHPSAA